MRVITLDTVDSTSDFLKKQEAAQEGDCVRARFQTSGHGQAANRWESERDKNLLFSILLRPYHVLPAKQFVITEIVTLAICDVLQPLTSQKITIKWPNDIYVGDKKLCGMLVENVISGSTIAQTVVGIGININQTKFVSDAPNPVSLRQITGKEFEIEPIFRKIVDRIMQRYIERKPTHEAYMKKLYRAKGYHAYRTAGGEEFEARIENIGEMGHLHLMERTGKERIFAFKEVVFV